MSVTYFTAGAVAAEIKARLQSILLVNQCETNIGRDVVMGRLKIPGDDKPPCIQVLEGLDDNTDQPGRIPLILVTQDYHIAGFDACDPDNPNDKAHAMIRDIKRAIFRDGSTWDGKVKMVKYMGRDIGPRADGAALVQVEVVIKVSYVEDLTNP